MSHNLYICILAIVTLLFARSLAVRTEAVNKYRNKYFMRGVTINIIILLSESIYYAVEGHMGLCRYANIMTNTISYICAPMLPYSIYVMCQGKRTKKSCHLAVLIYVNIIVVLLSLKTGWSFTVDENGIYRRQPFFLYTVLISFFITGLLVAASLRSYRNATVGERLYVGGIFCLAAYGVGMQLSDMKIASLWTSTAMCQLLYYTFLLERNSKYDALTGVRNRKAYEQAVEAIKMNKNREFCLVVVDINGLKKINDQFGHKEGDLAIMDLAAALIEAFAESSHIYRFGGDEFCIIGSRMNDSILEKRLKKLKECIQKQNQRRKIRLEIAYGSYFYDGDSEEKIEDVFRWADKSMYQNKQAFYHNLQ